MSKSECVLGVPKNEKGIQLIEMTYEVYTPELENDLEWFKFTASEIDDVFDLFLDFNEKLGTLIDFYEEDEIAADKIPEALRIAKKHFDKTPDQSKKRTIKKIIEALQLANDTKMPVGFFF